VTARSPADLPGIQPNMAILFYQKIRQVIAWHLSQESAQISDDSIELDERYLRVPNSAYHSFCSPHS